MTVPALDVLRRVDWWLVLLAVTLSAVGVLFIHSATIGEDGVSAVALRQILFLCIAAVAALGVVLVPYPRIMRAAGAIYVVAVVALLGLPWFGSILNGARRWYVVQGIGIQPSEFAKLAVIVALAAWLRFRRKARAFEGVVIPIAITALPVALIMMQPDLSSSLVFWPILLAMCYAAGTRGRTLVWLIAAGLVGLVLAYFTVMQEYQRARVDVWLDHFTWDPATAASDPEIATTLRHDGFQPWQSLIAVGSGGWTGFGYLHGPQSRFDFLPYRYGDYIFAVVAEESGLLGAAGVIGVQVALTLAILAVAARTRERFGRLLAVGIATYLGTQSLLHAAVCLWMLPSTGLPAPFLSQGGSATLTAALAVALAVNVGARREPVLSSDGFA